MNRDQLIVEPEKISVFVQGLDFPVVIESLETGEEVFKFENRGTVYNVINTGSSFDVWSRRKALGQNGGTVTPYANLKELAGRGKVFSKIANTIALHSKKPVGSIH